MSKKFTLPNGPLPWFAGPIDFSGANNLGLYAVDSTQRYVYGTRILAWDGRVFKYGYANGAVVPYHGVRASEAAALSYTANPIAGFIGDTSVTATLTSRAEDDLAGGYFALYHSTIDNTTQYGIVGNDATSGSTTRIHLDGRIPFASTVSFFHEIFENPYRETLESSNGFSAWVGVPMMNANAQSFWMQSWGPCLISPGNITLDDPAADERTVYWGTNAVLFEAAVTGATSESQHAGYILNQGTGIAGPIIMLMCST